MIPKIIHYCWMSEDPYPDKVQKCIESWKKYLPDYKIQLWNYNNFPRGKSQWVDQAFDAHKYAFAADYIRLYALYNYGGIYLDSDVEVIKSYDDLIDLPYFVGQEKTPSGIEAATMGFEPQNKLLGYLLDWYKYRNFVGPNNELDINPLPFNIRKCIESLFEYHVISHKTEFIYSENVFNVFSVDFFSPKHYLTKEISITPNTYSIHHFDGSWLDNNQTTDEQCNQNDREVKTYHSSSYKNIFRKVIRRLLFRKQITIVSNGEIEYRCCDLMGVSDTNPFRPSKCFIDNFIRYSELNVHSGFSEAFEFISREQSRRYRTIRDFYPILRLKRAGIEFHMVDYFSREEIRHALADFENNIQDRHIVYIVQTKKKLTRLDTYKACLLIRMGKDHILIH